MFSKNIAFVSAVVTICVLFNNNSGFCAIITRDVEPVILNDTPIIGILTQEISYHLDSKFPGEFKSFIAASYVKFLEGGGARVIPIWIDKPRDYYQDIMSKVNGVLMPGGATWFNQSNGYADAGRYIYEIAIEMNKNGEHMPIFGTCLGMELLFVLSTPSGEDKRADCASQRQALPLEFVKGFKSSELFGDAPSSVIKILSEEPVTANFHQFCVTREELINLKLDNVWNVLSVNHDFNGLEFVSSFEHYRYPFFGVQFHPEKNIYEWIENRNISHTSNAIQASQYFAKFFVDEARKNYNHFGSKDEENSALIYNFPTNYTALVKSAYEQCYLFDWEADYRIDAKKKNKTKIKSSINQNAEDNNSDW